MLQCIYEQCTIGCLSICSLDRGLALSLSALLIFFAFARPFVPHVRLPLVLVCAIACFSCNGFRAHMKVFKIYMFTTSSKTTIKSNYKIWSVRTCSQLDHVHSVRIRRAYACTGHTYNLYIHVPRNLGIYAILRLRYAFSESRDYAGNLEIA